MLAVNAEAADAKLRLSGFLVANQFLATSAALRRAFGLGHEDVLIVLTVALGIFRTQTPQGSPDWTGLMAGTTLAIIPTFIIFMLLGRRILDSIQFTGFK